MEDRILKQIEARKELISLLGDLPDDSIPTAATMISEQKEHGLNTQRWMLDFGGLESVPVLVVLPEGDGPFPVVLYNHAHGGHYEHGKEEILTGRRAILDPPYGGVLAQKGIATIGIDTFVFGERNHDHEAAAFKRMLWNGQVMWGMMVYDNLRALDLIEQHPKLDSERIATMGLSMGSTMAWWCAALDERIKVCIDLCCLSDFEALIETNNLNGHSVYYFVPNLLKEGWSTSRINELIAPRPRLALAGDLDPLTPPHGLEKINKHLVEIYSQMGSPENWRMVRYSDIGHVETPEMRKEVLAFLDVHL